MKRFIGLFLLIGGAGVAIWGGVCMLTGQGQSRLEVGEVGVNALAGGLIGLALLTVGLIWVRD